MDDQISRYVTALSGDAVTGTILHIGAGAGGQIDSYLATAARHICLVEPNPALCDKLEQRLADDPRLDLHTVAVAETDGFANLNVFNFTPLSSLYAPKDILDLYPGLKTLETPQVATMAVASLIAALPPLEDAGNLLVIDAPGAEFAILRALIDTENLRRFDSVIFACGTSQHYTDSHDAAAVTQALVGAGYKTRQQANDDPDFATLLMVCDRAALERQRLERLVQQAEDKAAKLERRLQEALSQIEAQIEAQTKAQIEAKQQADALHQHEKQFAAQADALKHSTAHGKQLATKLDDLEARHSVALESLAKAEKAQLELTAQLSDMTGNRDALAAECDRLTTNLRESHQERDHLNAQLAERDNALAQAQQALAQAEATRAQEAAEASARFDERQARVQHLSEERDHLNAQLAERDNALAQAQKALATRNSECETLNAQCEAMTTQVASHQQVAERHQRDLTMALRLQSIAHADLRDLQSRFAELRQQKEQQEALLRKLTPRLQEAARYLNDLPHISTAVQAPQEILKVETESKTPARPKARPRRKTGKTKTSKP